MILVLRPAHQEQFKIQLLLNLICPIMYRVMPGFSGDTEYTRGRPEVVNYEITSCALIWALFGHFAKENNKWCYC